MTNLGRAYSLDRAKAITGWMSDLELSLLAEAAYNSKIIIEAGSFMGKSTRAMADNTDGVIHAVDPWKPMALTSVNGMNVGVDEMTYTRFCLNLDKHIKSGRVIPHGMKFTAFNIDKQPDFIFIDALHDYKNVKQDIIHALELMKTGLLAGHDYSKSWPGVIEAVNEIFGYNHITITESIWSVHI